MKEAGSIIGGCSGPLPCALRSARGERGAWFGAGGPTRLKGRTNEPSFYCNADTYILSCNFLSHYDKLLLLISLISPQIS